jgi:predicted Zn-dependent protease
MSLDTDSHRFIQSLAADTFFRAIKLKQSEQHTDFLHIHIRQCYRDAIVERMPL